MGRSGRAPFSPVFGLSGDFDRQSDSSEHKFDDCIFVILNYNPHTFRLEANMIVASLISANLTAFLFDTTILGMPLATFTAVHVLISLIAIGSGVAVVFGMLRAKRLDTLTAVFLVTTILTSVTGFLFPNDHVTPGIILGVISLVALAVSLVARYTLHMRGAWRSVYVITAVMALYFNVFVLVAQSFEKVPALHALAPTQKEPPFAIAQLIVLVVFIVVGIFAVKNFRLGADVTSMGTWRNTKAS